ncbi:V-type ATP synthase subunit I [Microlunatus sp. Gsoil 973]|uniref:V-type ATP synthase subunit I n=1 Tax=Microlunatus sp. Gsoil 973 TaxID=2672569 RepID=UPI0018A8021B|nr:V-type ATPase 116kDa subunit family protein [Microlunatus sp. Gsoil 973]
MDQRLDSLHNEELNLASQMRPLKQLVPLVPIIAALNGAQLAQLHLATVALVINTGSAGIPQMLRDELTARLGNTFELATTQIEDGSVGCLVIFPSEKTHVVREILGRAAVRSEALPSRFEGLSLTSTVEAMQLRIDEIAAECARVEHERRQQLARRRSWLRGARAAVLTELDLTAAARTLVATERVFVAEAWIPRRRVAELRHDLDSRFAGTVVVEHLTTSRSDHNAPVLMHNTKPARPYESLVRFLELPRAGSSDPTFLMAIFLPMMFGAMVGDIAYGLILLLLALVAHYKLAQRLVPAAELSGVVWVLIGGAAWSIVFGVLYGEALGDLGHRLFGDFALWRDRTSGGALEPLLLLSVAVGAAHIVLGLGIGAWQAIRLNTLRVLVEKVGMLLALAGLFGVVAVAAGRLSSTAMAPALAAVVAGLALIMSLNGVLGIATGALDLLAKLGNILSYLRLAAVGLASAHLANVANQLGTLGPVWLGIVIAIFLHALNLALASFSPLIQSLRLHYVEFFGAFLIGGGRAFQPFGSTSEREALATQ